VTGVEWRDPLIKAEQAVDTELGLSWERSGLGLQLNAYRMDFSDEIVPFGGINPANGLAVRGNADKSLHRGIELALDARLDRLGWIPARWGGQRIQAALSRSWDEYEDFIYYEDVYDPDTWEYVETVAHDYAGNPIPHFPQYLVSLRLDSSFGPLATGLRYRAAGRQYLDNSGLEARSIDPYQQVDAELRLEPAGLGLHALAGLELHLRVVNLLSEEYETWGYYDASVGETYKVPAAERHFLLGVDYEF
jgi:iron complex outermembrane receptor protein